jgi:uncharacterized protein YndB with AHSA1/START domain
MTTTRIDDRVTGAAVEVTMQLAVSPDALWRMIADVPAIGAWSPECIGARWLDGGSAAAPGARFAAQNRFRDGVVRDVEGVVTEVHPDRSFAWDVLDAADAAGSRWRYDLTPGPDGRSTLVRHRFEHGPGETGMRSEAASDATMLAARLAEICSNISRTLLAMEAAASSTS